MDDDFEDEQVDDDKLDDDESGVVLSFGSDGKAELHKSDDFTTLLNEDAELIKDFIAANQELFNLFLQKRKSGGCN